MPTPTPETPAPSLALTTRMVFLDYALPEMAFVFAGATMSPRYQGTTATGLAVRGIFLSLMTQ